MTYDVYLPWIAAACFGVLGARLAGRMRPSHATWFLTIGGAIVSLCALSSLVMLALSLIGQVHPVAAIGDWSASALGRRTPVARTVSVMAMAGLAVACASSGRVLVGRVRTLALAHRTCRRLPASVGRLVVTADGPASPYAVPGRPGRIVVTVDTLKRLAAGERRALLAHEES
ncbi:MAG: hypothetical protein QOJ62_442, partial [Actinomycetota bacterium]|nr:hypothetical protein [Actinomycetota bacterium]